MNANLIVFDDISKFYGEVLGVNRVNLSIGPGITSFVGPNGSGKTTLMNLMTGLLKPTRGKISVLGVAPDHPEKLFRILGYCSQFDSFPAGMTGRELIYSFLLVHGFTRTDAAAMTQAALEQVNLLDAADRKIEGYSKGMRQRIRLGQAIAHRPRVLILDEPLNGLDPLARAEVIAIFRQCAREGMYLILSSHILHEVDLLSDSVVLLNNGYIVAEGDVSGVRSEIADFPLQITIRCGDPSLVAAQLFGAPHVMEVRLHEDRGGMIVKTRNPDQFYVMFNHLVIEHKLTVESIAPFDDDLQAVYQYLIR
ncbi:MAG TPA: ABC transporter ATP-binding protein [Acidobacteriota bacterium]|nr:ABC transporter ATP-binding protein [Acidobacteriota bacterium]